MLPARGAAALRPALPTLLPKVPPMWVCHLNAIAGEGCQPCAPLPPPAPSSPPPLPQLRRPPTAAPRTLPTTSHTQPHLKPQTPSHLRPLSPILPVPGHCLSPASAVTPARGHQPSQPSDGPLGSPKVPKDFPCSSHTPRPGGWKCPTWSCKEQCLCCHVWGQWLGPCTWERTVCVPLYGRTWAGREGGMAPAPRTHRDSHPCQLP